MQYILAYRWRRWKIINKITTFLRQYHWTARELLYSLWRLQSPTSDCGLCWCCRQWIGATYVSNYLRCPVMERTVTASDAVMKSRWLTPPLASSPDFYSGSNSAIMSQETSKKKMEKHSVLFLQAHTKQKFLTSGCYTCLSVILLRKQLTEL